LIHHLSGQAFDSSQVPVTSLTQIWFLASIHSPRDLIFQTGFSSCRTWLVSSEDPAICIWACAEPVIHFSSAPCLGLSRPELTGVASCAESLAVHSVFVLQLIFPARAQALVGSAPAVFWFRFVVAHLPGAELGLPILLVA
jgi:hypothetical protein